MASMHERLARGLARGAGLRVFRLFTRALDPGATTTVRAGLELRVLGERDVVPLCRNAELDLRVEKVNAAYARGDFCAGAYESGELAGYCWFAFSRLPHLDGVWVDFDEEGVWMYKSLVLPLHRGRRIAPALYRFTDRLCAERHRTSSIICTEAHNRPSISAIRRAGYTAAGYAGYLRRGKTLLTWASPAAARRTSVHFYVPDSRG
jgi:GNAT superfamily N-acetyltransferase